MFYSTKNIRFLLDEDKMTEAVFFAKTKITSQKMLQFLRNFEAGFVFNRY